MPFGRIDPKLVTYDGIASSNGGPGDASRHTDGVDYIGTGHVWRGKPKVHGQVKQPTEIDNTASALARVRTTYQPQQTTNKGPFKGRLSSPLGFFRGRERTH